MNTPVQFAEKPPQSKIKLTRNLPSLLICIPPVRDDGEIIPFIMFDIVWNGLLLLMTVHVFRNFSTVNWGVATFFIPLWALLYSLLNLPKSSLLPTTVACSLLFTLCCVFECLLLLFGKRYIRADRQSINHISMLFGIRVSRHRMIFKKNIKSLTLVRKSWWLDDSITNLPTLKIGEGSKQISIGAGMVKREEEITWLATEISDWLSIPINIVDQNAIDQNLDINNN
jgi:hypothetical protein